MSADWYSHAMESSGEKASKETISNHGS
jgi:hypothetical protein